MTKAAKPRLFFATIAAGGGHVATARAMMEAVGACYPGQFELTMSDYMKDLGLLRLDQSHKDGWRWALRYPLSARLGQRLIDAAPGITNRVLRRVLAEFARRAAEHLDASAVDLVISNHGLLTVGLALASHRFGLRIPVLTFATEPYNISAYWAEPRADHFVAPSQAVKANLVRMGVPEGKIDIVGYPVGQSFLRAPQKDLARKRLGLDEIFTCLVSLGGEGVGGWPLEIVRALLAKDVGVVVITGRNARLRQALEGLGASPGKLCVKGFVDEMALYLAASDVVVGKAGPASVFEALAVGRPVLVAGYAGLNEWAVVEFLKRHRLGHYLPQSADLAREVARYRAAPELLEKVSASCRNLHIASMTEQLAHYVVSYALHGPPQARLTAGGLP